MAEGSPKLNPVEGVSVLAPNKFVVVGIGAAVLFALVDPNKLLDVVTGEEEPNNPWPDDLFSVVLEKLNGRFVFLSELELSVFPNKEPIN